jgi:hypothetical protein
VHARQLWSVGDVEVDADIFVGADVFDFTADLLHKLQDSGVRRDIEQMQFEVVVVLDLNVDSAEQVVVVVLALVVNPDRSATID